MCSSYVTQMYRGQLKNGSRVAIRCIEMKKRYSTQNLMHHMELISKLRHCHLVSTLGHCFECSLEDSSVTKIFLVFECVPNGTLSSWISGNSLNNSYYFLYLKLVKMLIDQEIERNDGKFELRAGLVPQISEKFSLVPNINNITD